MSLEIASNTADPKGGIFVHNTFLWRFQTRGDKMKKKMVDFVSTLAADWEPTKHSAVCSQHFKPDDYIYQFALLSEVSSKPSIPRHKRDGVIYCLPNLLVYIFCWIFCKTLVLAAIHTPFLQLYGVSTGLLQKAVYLGKEAHV